MTNKIQKNIAEELGQLLAESSIDNNLKEILIENMDHLPGHLVFRLRDSLRAEKEEFERVAFEIGLFLEKQKENWTKTTEEQKKVADILAKKWMMKLSK